MSDHAAISLALHPPKKEAVVTQFIPDWVSGHPSFGDYVGEVLADCRVASCPYERLLNVKEAIQCASILVKEKMLEERLPKTMEEQLYWAVLL